MLLRGTNYLGPIFLCFCNSLFITFIHNSKLPEHRGHALDSLGKAYASKRAYTEAADAFEQKLAISKTPLERSYLFHEIGRCFYELGKYDVTTFYANQSHEEALKCKDYHWLMNAKILLAQVDSKFYDCYNICKLRSLCNYISYFLFSEIG